MKAFRMELSTNPFLFVGKPVRDEYGRQISRVASFIVSLNGRVNRAVLNAEDVRRFCNFIASLCREAGSKEASALCAEAAEAVMKDEKRHLKICEQSYTLCHEGRFPAETRAERATYVI